MKPRLIAATIAGSAVLAWALMSCDLLNSVSIDQRISNFQADLNNSDRSNIYQDFHPTETSLYDTLKSDQSTIDTPYPVPSGTNYAIVIDDESNTAAVVAHMTSYPGTVTLIYLQLQMDTYNGKDWRIVKLSTRSAPPPGTYSQLIY